LKYHTQIPACWKGEEEKEKKRKKKEEGDVGDRRDLLCLQVLQVLQVLLAPPAISGVIFFLVSSACRLEGGGSDGSPLFLSKKFFTVTTFAHSCTGC